MKKRNKKSIHVSDGQLNNNSEFYLITDFSNDICIVISAIGNDKCITQITALYLLEQ